MRGRARRWTRRGDDTVRWFDVVLALAFLALLVLATMASMVSYGR